MNIFVEEVRSISNFIIWNPRSFDCWETIAEMQVLRRIAHEVGDKHALLVELSCQEDSKPQMPQTQRDNLFELSQLMKFPRRFYLSNLVESINRFLSDRFD